MGEDRKKVWEKVREAYEAEAEKSRRYIVDTGQFNRPELALAEIFKVQAAFQRECKPISDERSAMFTKYASEAACLPRTSSPLWREMMRVNVLATIAEMTELLESTPWKPWRSHDGKAMDHDEVWEAKLECIDAMCFLMNCFMLLGGDGTQFGNLYLAKMAENSARQKGGY